MEIRNLRLDGLKLIKPDVYVDERGFFSETYQQERYLEAGIVAFVQDNLSFSKMRTIRGLHFQKKPGQAKLISVIWGRIWDVAVDLRTSSTTFGQWESVELDSATRWQFYIPAGFAHGYCVLSDLAYVHYKVSTAYDPREEGSIRWNDPDLNITWPFTSSLLSPRDQNSPFFQEIFSDLKQRST